MYNDFECPWFFIHNSHKALLGACILVFGVMGVLLNSWMVITFVKSKLLSFKSHILVLNLCTACLSRGLVGGFPFAGPSAVGGRWLFGEPCCQMFAFLNQLLAVFQMTALTVLCFERYLLIKHMKNGKELSIKFYVFCISMCWVSSVVWSVPPLMDYGSYTCDSTGTSCSLDWRTKTKRQLAFNVPFALFAGLLPLMIIFYSLWKALKLGTRQRATEIEWEQWSLTKSTFAMSSLMLLMWTPSGVLAGWLWAGGVGWGNYSPPPPLPVVLLAPLGSEASTLIPLLCYLASDPRIRTALLGRCKNDYGIIRGGKRVRGRPRPRPTTLAFESVAQT